MFQPSPIFFGLWQPTMDSQGASVAPEAAALNLARSRKPAAPARRQGIAVPRLVTGEMAGKFLG